MAVFTAIELVTANRLRDSVCAVGAVRVEHGKIVVREAPGVERIWPELRALLRGIDFVVAHDASSGMAMLAASCERAGVRPPSMRVKCTLQEARAWGVRPATLPAVARHLGLRDRGRRAAIDGGIDGAMDNAETCAEIALAGGLAA